MCLLPKVGGKGLFVKRWKKRFSTVRQTLLSTAWEDVPTDFPKGLHLAVICRGRPGDAFISRVKGSRVKGSKNFKLIPSKNCQMGRLLAQAV